MAITYVEERAIRIGGCKRAYIVVFLVAEQTVDRFGVLTIGYGAELVVHSIFKFKN